MAWRIAIVLVLVLALAGGCWAAVCSWRWRRGTAALRRRLESGRIGGTPPAFDARELAGLPPPVRRYLQAVLRPGQAIPAAASFTHRGFFSLGKERPKWMPFTSAQRVVADQHATRELALGELQRFLAEAPWMPTLLLPGQNVGWEEIDDASARAT